MPVIHTDTTYFNGETIKLRYSVDSKGQFYLNLPKVLVNRLGVNSTIHADTLAELKREWANLHGQFNESTTTRTKIIAWFVEITARIYDDTISIPVLNKNELHFAKGLGLAFAVGVYTLESTKAGNDTNERLEWEPSSIPLSANYRNVEYWDWKSGNIPYVEWTQEREDFFADFVIAFENLIVKLDSFLKPENTKNLLAAIESGLRLIGSGESESPDPDWEKE